MTKVEFLGEQKKNNIYIYKAVCRVFENFVIKFGINK